METLKTFSDSAKTLSRNPLGIISLFIVLIYGFAAFVTGSSSQLEAGERLPLVWFLVIFPNIVLVAFVWLVSQHYEKLYAPRDFNSDDAFLNALREKNQGRPELKNLDKQIEERVHAVLSSESLLPNNGNRNEIKEKLSRAADEITSQIRQSSFLTIDASPLTGSNEDIFEFPVSAFNTLGDLTNEIYFSINQHVRPFEYGHSWVIRNPISKQVIKNARMITGTKIGIPLPDGRSLSEVGIKPGMTLEIVRPSKND